MLFAVHLIIYWFKNYCRSELLSISYRCLIGVEEVMPHRNSSNLKNYQMGILEKSSCKILTAYKVPIQIINT